MASTPVPFTGFVHQLVLSADGSGLPVADDGCATEQERKSSVVLS
ncbi:hypothetical protein STVIR_8070 [Streptomyces viridochromogenes Tue57]|uniref:Uncharacterized protein n=1 Tax=Streptomyces viridochromogenes Tue57 TaxID=1160705 RepID=L8P3C9_STRVR|nr:hypothetical protein STVIR_8070 [Streptomyces viridochromogenes Tue57]